jgi:alpha/beta superfamily hydrolase
VNRYPVDPTIMKPEQAFALAGPGGTLEARWRPARGDAKTAGVVVVAHPHPAQGGTMLNKVVFHTARVLNHDLDFASLRFNFRGVGASAGQYDEGRGEVDDLLAAWAEAERRVPGGSVVAAGFSFGAAMTLRATARRAEDKAPLPAALALIGLPTLSFRPPAVLASVPVAAVHGEHDQFTPPEEVGRYLEQWPGPTAFHMVRGADHFLGDGLPEALGFLSRSLKGWL